MSTVDHGSVSAAGGSVLSVYKPGTFESKMSERSDTSSDVILAAENNDGQLVVFQEESCEADQLVDRREYSLASGMQFNATL